MLNFLEKNYFTNIYKNDTYVIYSVPSTILKHYKVHNIINRNAIVYMVKYIDTYHLVIFDNEDKDTVIEEIKKLIELTVDTEYELDLYLTYGYRPSSSFIHVDSDNVLHNSIVPIDSNIPMNGEYIKVLFEKSNDMISKSINS